MLTKLLNFNSRVKRSLKITFPPAMLYALYSTIRKVQHPEFKNKEVINKSEKSGLKWGKVDIFNYFSLL